MTPLIRFASVIFMISLVAFFLCGLSLIWLQSAKNSEALWKIFGSSFLVMVVAGYYIAVRDALTRIRRNSKHNHDDLADK
jgi:arginine exporter protein ArgO